ncbi:MAG: glycosyltransferase [Pirellulales bacterium]|nr:glycosyltransferase [Pirellulales bacterium]
MTSAIIVVPCYNEAQRLKVARFHDFASGLPGVRFLMVNDGSRDDTLSRLHQLAAADPNHFSVLNLPRNGGKAEAIRQGVLYAMKERPDFVGYWDADLATPLEAIPSFIEVLKRRPEILLVVGTRVRLLGHDIRRRPIRRLLGRFFASAASWTLRIRIRDTQCGAKLFRATPEMLAIFAESFRSRWIFDVELLARLIAIRPQASRMAVSSLLYELPLDFWEDVAGSRLKRSDFVKAIGDLVQIWWQYLRPGASAYSSPFELPATERRRAA